jgi:hypothetical protein
LSILPENAFLPSYLLNAPERFGWMARRNSLFANATAEEKRVLIGLADWYAVQRFVLLHKPNVFSDSAAAMVFSHYPWMAAGYGGQPALPPGWAVRALAKVSALIDWGDARLMAWQCRRFQDHLTRLVNLQQDADVMLGVMYFLCSLRMEFPSVNSGQWSTNLFALAKASLANHATPATRLLGKVADLIVREESTGHQQQLGAGFPKMKEHVWRLLLSAAQQDTQRALSFIDDHWRKPSKWSGLLSVFALHGQPDLAYQLSIVTRPYRPEFAADMLLECVSEAGWTVMEKGNEAPVSLPRLLDDACDLLWGWVHESLPSGSANEDQRNRLASLFRYGNPKRPYWSELPVCALSAIKAISLNEQARVLPSGLLAQVIFYSDPGSPTAISAMTLFRACLFHRMRTADSVRQHIEAAVDVTKAIEVLEGGILAGRNRFVAAQPEHSLMQVVADYLDETQEKMRVVQPSTVLADQMSLTLGVRVETLYRRLMDQFRAEFALQVEFSPTDAGLALKNLIQYKGFSQTDDAMYRKQVCQDVFDALIPRLEEVSSADASVARSGIGWSPRGDI